MHEIDKIVDDFVAPAFVGWRFEPGFGGAVEQDDGEGEPEPAKRHAADRTAFCLALVANFELQMFDGAALSVSPDANFRLISIGAASFAPTCSISAMASLQRSQIVG